MSTVGVIGMGRMGQAVASLLENQPGITCSTFQRITPDRLQELKQCDVVIEFTIPAAAPDVIRQCLELDIPVISGTTGWHEYHLESILTLCKQRKGKMLYATNFSIGMNIVFALNRKLASVTTHFPQFKPSLKEVHHIHKKDSPSGTAYTLLEDILSQHHEFKGFLLNPSTTKIPDDQLAVTAIREGEVKGYHQVEWTSDAEKILISHEAFDRSIFAQGAIMAANWLVGQPVGSYTMRDIINV